MPENFAIPRLQEKGCLKPTIFMQDGAPAHIGRRVYHIFNNCFSRGRIIRNATEV